MEKIFKYKIVYRDGSTEETTKENIKDMHKKYGYDIRLIEDTYYLLTDL